MIENIDLTRIKPDNTTISGMPETTTSPIKKPEVSIGETLSANNACDNSLSISNNETKETENKTPVNPKLAQYGIDLDKPFTVTKEMIEKMKKKGKKGFLESLKDNAKNAIPFVSGALEIKKSIELLAIAKKQERGEKLTREETEQLYLYLLEQVENEHRDSTFMGKVGEMLSHLPAFAGEFAVTGGLYSAGNKVALKASQKILGHVVKKQVAKTLVKKAAAVAVGAAFRTVALSNTYAGIAQRRTTIDTSKMQQETLSDGTKVSTGELNIKKSDESLGTSIAKGLADGYIESLSEQSGQALMKPLGKIPVVGKFLAPAKESQKFLNKIGYHGLLEEYAEERFGGFLRGAIALDKPQEKGYLEHLYESTIPTWEQTGVELTTTALWGGAMTGSHKVFNSVQKLNIKDVKETEAQDKSIPKTIKMPNGATIQIATDIVQEPLSRKEKIGFAFASIFENTFKRKYIKKLKKGTLYKPVRFETKETIAEAKKFAKKTLGIQLIANNNEQSLAQVNKVLSLFTDIYNKSHGKIKLPQLICISDIEFKKIKKSPDMQDAAACAALNIAIYMPENDHNFIQRILHELGHINHNYRITFEKTSEKSILTKEFLENKELLSKIQQEVSNYACTSPSEFVAEMYAGLMRGKTYSPELMERYNMYKGPTNWRFYVKEHKTSLKVQNKKQTSRIIEKLKNTKAKLINTATQAATDLAPVLAVSLDKLPAVPAAIANLLTSKAAEGIVAIPALTGQIQDAKAQEQTIDDKTINDFMVSNFNRIITDIDKIDFYKAATENLPLAKKCLNIGIKYGFNDVLEAYKINAEFADKLLAQGITNPHDLKKLVEADSINHEAVKICFENEITGADDVKEIASMFGEDSETILTCLNYGIKSPGEIRLICESKKINEPLVTKLLSAGIKSATGINNLVLAYQLNSDFVKECVNIHKIKNSNRVLYLTILNEVDKETAKKYLEELKEKNTFDDETCNSIVNSYKTNPEFLLKFLAAHNIKNIQNKHDELKLLYSTAEQYEQNKMIIDLCIENKCSPYQTATICSAYNLKPQLTLQLIQAGVPTSAISILVHEIDEDNPVLRECLDKKTISVNSLINILIYNKHNMEISQKLVNKIGLENANSLDEHDYSVACELIGLANATSINTISLSDKKELLKSLITSNTGLFEISENLRKFFPLIPKDSKGYSSLLSKLVRSLGIETNTLNSEQISQFNKSMDSLGETLSTLSTQEFIDLQITQEFSKDDFIKVVVEKTKDLSEEERQKIFDYFGFELQNNTNTSTGYSIVGYPVNLNNGKKLSQIKNETTKAVVESLRADVIKFSEQKVKSNNPQIEKLLNDILSCLPELQGAIEKKQHETHDFTVMKHSLKVMQKITQDENFKKLNDSDKKIMLLASLLHDITKAESKRDKTHATESSFDTFFIAKKFNLTKEEEIKLYKLIRHHEWLAVVNNPTTNESNKDIMALATNLLADIEITNEQTADAEIYFEVSRVAREYDLTQEEKKKLLALIKNPELIDITKKSIKPDTLKRRLQSVAFDLGQDNLFDMALIFTHADLRAVKFDDSFHDKTGYGAIAEKYSQRIKKYINELKTTQPLLPVTKFPKAEKIRAKVTQINPDGSTNIKGVYIDKNGLVIIKYNEVESWEDLGFPKGTISKGISTTCITSEETDEDKTDGEEKEIQVNTGNINFFVHGLDHANQLAKFDAFSLVDSDVLLSVSYAERAESKYRFFRPQGVVLDVDTKYIHGGLPYDFGSDIGKDIQNFKDKYLFGGEHEEGRTYISELIKGATGMSTEEYMKFVEENKNKSLLEIEPVELREKLIKTFAQIYSSERGHSRSYNEMLISNPNVMGVFAYAPKWIIGNPIEYLSTHAYKLAFLKRFALEKGIPFIMFGE